MRPIDADARIYDLIERYCKECDKRKGIKNGKRQFIYEIGEAPCRACEVDDVKAELEEAPAIDALPIVRCKDCKWYGRVDKRRFYRGMDCLQKHIDTIVPDRDFCSKAERRGE